MNLVKSAWHILEAFLGWLRSLFVRGLSPKNPGQVRERVYALEYVAEEPEQLAGSTVYVVRTCARRSGQCRNVVFEYAGVAPVTERSGNKCWVHWRYSCSTFLRQTFIEWVGQTIPRSFWAKAFYEAYRARGGSHQAALRALAFKWIRILYRCWIDRLPYDESKYLMALQKRQPPLLKHAASAST